MISELNSWQETGLQKLSIVLGDARNGSKTAAEAFAKLGIDIAKSGNTEDTFRQVAQAISEIQDPAAKAAAAVDVFGRSGVKLLNFLNQGEAGLAAMEAEAEKLGITLNRVEGAQIEMANDALSRLGTVTTAIGNKLAIELAPIIQGVAESLLSATDQGFNFGDVVSTAIDWIVKGLGVVLDVVHTVKLGFRGLQAVIIKGMAYSLDGIVMLGKGLESLLNLIPGVEVSFGSALEGIQDSLHKTADEAFDQLSEDFAEVTPSEALNSWLDDVRAKSQAAAEAIANATSGVADMGEGMSKASEDAQKLIEKLTEQIATFGMSSTEAEIFKLSQEGVDQFLLDQISTLDAQLKALEDSKQKQEELSSAAQSVIEGLKTPFDKYKEEVSSLQELLSTNNISQDQFDKALKQATGKLSTEADKVTLSSPQLISKGSQAEAAFLANFRTSDPITDVAMNQEETNSILKDILRALGIKTEVVEEIAVIA
jgi:predicted  nucleic acid-binding Zn-ribbon protein